MSSFVRYLTLIAFVSVCMAEVACSPPSNRMRRRVGAPAPGPTAGTPDSPITAGGGTGFGGDTPINQATGGQDGGGGVTRSSTAEQVREAIKKAYDLGATKERRQNIFVRYWLSTTKDLIEGNSREEKKSEYLRISFPTHLFPGLKGIRQEGTTTILDPSDLKDYLTSTDYDGFDHVLDESKFDSPVLKALREKPPQLLETGDCQQPDQEIHADASVSQLNLQGKVCFSVGNLQRIPPEDLLKEILSLLLHEAIHLGGGDEAEAKLWQEDFARFYAHEFSPRIGPLAVQSLADMAIIMGQVEAATKLNKTNPADPRIFSLMGITMAKLNTLPSYLDPIALHITFNTAQPASIDAYSNAVLATIEKIKTEFNLPETADFPGKPNPDAQPMGAADIEKALAAVFEYVRIALHNLFLLAMDGKGQPKCLLPKGVPIYLRKDEGINFVNFMTYREIPPRVCAD